MVALQRIRVEWQGFVGGPGVNTFYSVDAASSMTPLRDFYAGLAFAIPLGIHVSVINSGDILDSVTGLLTGSWAGPGTAVVEGSDATAVAAPAGMMVKWLTTTIVDGRRLRGRTFVVPIGVSNYEHNGSIIAGSLDLARAAAVALVSASGGNLYVWHRPRKARAATATRPAVTARAGFQGQIVGSDVPDKTVVLRSRRD